MKTLNVGLIGYKFMGRMHSNAWIKAPLFFDLNIQPVRKLICGIPEKPLQAFAEKWGWQESTTDWREVVERPDIDIVDIRAAKFASRHCRGRGEGRKAHLLRETAWRSPAQAQEMYAGREDGRHRALPQPQLPARPRGRAGQTSDRRGQDRTDLPLARGVPAVVDH